MTTTELSPAAQAAELDTEISKRMKRAEALQRTIAGTDYARRAAAREELGDVEVELEALRGSRADLEAALSTERAESNRREAELATARRLLAAAPQWFSHPLGDEAGGIVVLDSPDPRDITDPARNARVYSFYGTRSLRAAAARLRAAGEPIPDAITITIEL